MRLSYALLRIGLALNICMHGAVRWIAGLAKFAGSLVPMFQKSPLPVWSVYAFGYMLPVVEAIIGACVLLGFQTRRALIAGSVLMLILTFGSTLRQDWPTVGIQLTYSVVYSLLLAAVQFNSFCVDQLTGQKAGS
jgi:thiosulfate dehydrogenase [quinone] large subunit